MCELVSFTLDTPFYLVYPVYEYRFYLKAILKEYRKYE